MDKALQEIYSGVDVFSKDWCQYNANDFLSDFLCVEVVPITNLAEVKTKALFWHPKKTGNAGKCQC